MGYFGLTCSILMVRALDVIKVAWIFSAGAYPAREDTYFYGE